MFFGFKCIHVKQKNHSLIDIYILTMENFAERTDSELYSLCKFTGMICTDEFFRKIENATHKSHRRRYKMEWSPKQKHKIKMFIRKYLSTYYDPEF